MKPCVNACGRPAKFRNRRGHCEICAAEHRRVFMREFKRRYWMSQVDRKLASLDAAKWATRWRSDRPVAS